MGKLNKSDDPQSVQRIVEFPPCKHFTEGTFVVQNNRRGEVLHVGQISYGGQRELMVRWDDGKTSIVRPFALSEGRGT